MKRSSSMIRQFLLTAISTFAFVLAAASCRAQERAAERPAAANEAASEQSLADTILADTMNDLWQFTDEHFHKGEFNHIVNLDRVIVQAQPRRREAYANSAWLLWSTDRNDDAVAFLKQGVAALPDDFYMYDELGQHYFTRLHDPKAAILYYEKAVQFPCPYVTLHGLANCYEKTGQWEKAVTTWERAAKYKDDKLAPEKLKRAQAELAKRRR